MNLYFDCSSGISGDMAVAALLGLGADKNTLDKALKSMNLDNEFTYEIKDVLINSIQAVDFNVILPNQCKNHHNHCHRNLDDINKIIDKADMCDKARKLAKEIFRIVAISEAKVHGKNIIDVHFHEIGAIDSIVDIVAFSTLLYTLKPENIYFSTLAEGSGFVECQHGTLSVPVPAVCEILSQYKIPFSITDNQGEMITPTGVSIVAALYQAKSLPSQMFIESIGYGAGKRKYKNPILRVMSISEQ